MSAPETDLKRQRRRHVGPLIGLALVVLFGVGIIFYWLTEEADRAPGPQGETSPPAATQSQDVTPSAPETMGTTGTPTQPGATPEPAVPAVPTTPVTPPAPPAGN